MCILSDFSREKDSDIREGKTFHDLADSELIVSIDEAGYIDEQKNEIYQSISAHLDDYTKSILNRIGNSLHLFANKKSITYILYVFGYFLLFLYLFYEFAKLYPLSALFLSATVITLLLAANRDIAFIETKKFFDWLDLGKALNLSFRFVFIYILLFKGLIFDFIRLISPREISYIESIIRSLSLFDYICILFSACFLYELTRSYKQNKNIFNFIITKLMLPFSSFMLLFVSRCIIVSCTGTEPAILSRASTLFALVSGVIVWPFLCILFLPLLYAFYSLWSVAYGLISFLIKNSLNMLRTTIIPYIFPELSNTIERRENWGSYSETGFIHAGNASATFALIYLSLKIIFNEKIFSFFLVSLAPLLLYFYPPSYEINLPESQIIHLAETLIVRLDYRPFSHFSECNNLSSDEWGLLIGPKKISVATKRELGGYSFTTRSCRFGRHRFIEG